MLKKEAYRTSFPFVGMLLPLNTRWKREVLAFIFDTISACQKMYFLCLNYEQSVDG